MCMTKILVIDDDQTILEYFIRIQDRLKCEVISATTGDEGCRLIQELDFQIIIMDFCIPGGLEKLELLQKLKELKPDLPVIVISGYSSPDLVAKCQELGASEFLAKPFELSFLPEIIQRLLGPT